MTPIAFAMLLSCGPDNSYPVQVLISDGSGEQWFIGSLEDESVSTRYDLNEHQFNECNKGVDSLWCMTFQSRLRKSNTGKDEVVYSYNAVEHHSDESSLVRDSSIVGVGLSSSDANWVVDAIDFSSHFGLGDPCTWDAADTCSPSPKGDEVNDWQCRLYETHDVQVVEEDSSNITMWVADSKNARLLKLELDKTSRCATVLEIVSARHPDWDIYITPNSFQIWQEQGADVLLVTFKSTNPDADFTQDGGTFRGKVAQFRKRGDEWEQDWEFPPESVTGESFVNSPHGVVRTTISDGSTWVLFAHSLSLGSDFGVGAGGTIGALKIDNGEPTYMFDATPDAAFEWQYTRDIEALSDGNFLVADAGCTSGLECENETGLFVVDLNLLEATPPPKGSDGVYEEGRGRLNIQPVEIIAGPFFSDTSMIYSVEEVP